jgi:hypothetical protein
MEGDAPAAAVVRTPKERYPVAVWAVGILQLLVLLIWGLRMLTGGLVRLDLVRLLTEGWGYLVVLFILNPLVFIGVVALCYRRFRWSVWSALVLASALSIVATLAGWIAYIFYTLSTRYPSGISIVS